MTTVLAAREQEVLVHVAAGLTYRAIARRMGLSPHTVDSYLRRIRAKTGATSRAQLIILAVTLDLRRS